MAIDDSVLNCSSYDPENPNQSNPTPVGARGAQNPYSFFYPNNQLDKDEMFRLAGNNSLGPGGSTWWVCPVAVGREEDGVDVIYRGATYGSPENRELVQGSMSAELYTNKSRGEAVITVSRLRIEGDNNESEFETVAINDRLISYREDEHHQPSVQFNMTNGQLMTSWGARNSARTQSDAAANTINHYRYGYDISKLSYSETVTYPSTADYSQNWFVGNTSFVFQRDDVGDWSFVTGSGGQNYSTPTKLLDSQGEQYYIKTAYTDFRYVGEDEGVEYNRPTLHFFFDSHPTVVADRTLRYARGEFYLAGTGSIAFDSGGIWLRNPSGGVSGSLVSADRLGDALPFVKTDFETAYTSAPGKSHRLLDIQYGYAPRALIGEFDFDWTHGASIPFGKTWDLILVTYNPYTRAWSSLTLKTGIRGGLGFKPNQAAFDQNGDPIAPTTRGVEGYTSFYQFGACFYRGKNYLDVAPVVYYCDREGINESNHRLHRITLENDYSAIAAGGEVALIENSQKILYRPETTLYGNKRICFYNAARGWSSFNSFTAEDRWLDETAQFPASAPVISVQPANVSVADGSTVIIGLVAASVGGERLTYQWEFEPAGGGGFSPASATTPNFLLTGSAAANGRKYRCVVTNSIGSVTSNTITVSIV